MPIAMLGGMEVALLVPGLLLALVLGRAPVRQTLPWLLLFLDCGAVIIDSQRRKSCDPKLRLRTNQEALCISELAQGYPMSFESTDHDVVTVRITVCELSMFLRRGSLRALAQMPRQESELETALRRSHPHERRAIARCRERRGQGCSRLGARGHPTRGDRAGPFHLSRGFARSRNGREPSPAGRVATGTT